MWHNKLLTICCASFTFLVVVNAAVYQYYHYPAPRYPFTLPSNTRQQHYQQQYISYTQNQQLSAEPQRQSQQNQYRPETASYYQQTQALPTSIAANVARKFSSPALEHAAFVSALTSQGDIFDGSYNADASISSARALPAPTSAATVFASSENILTNASIDSTDASINLKLPLMINTAPIKASPLPLQAGASFDDLSHGVTSYGTSYSQRRRRR